MKVFGSQLTNILTPSSDLDLCILNVPMKNQEDKSEISKLLLSLADRIKEEGLDFASYVEAIVNAKVPIVKFDHAPTGIAVDICLNEESGLRTGYIIRDLVQQYPPLRHLTIVLKVFLSQRGMNETYSGGVGSFVLVSMVASFLQMRARQVELNLHVYKVKVFSCTLFVFFFLFIIAKDLFYGFS